MARVFAGMVLGVFLFSLLVVGAYTVRLTPEVLNCDRGRQTQRRCSRKSGCRIVHSPGPTPISVPG